MQPLKQLAHVLENLADRDHYLFSLDDLRAALPGHGPAAFKSLAGRAEKDGLLRRVCRGLYLYPKVEYPAGLVLYHAAARLRAHEFNYLSLESALSDAGVISQIPMHWITLMSSGRSYIFDCGTFGHIEFIHTKKSPGQVASRISYDPRCRLWRASVALALQDMARTRRDTDLVNWEAARELV
ncbi:MAG: type IV toxin-antitoxin system AbiEi family antitoxin [Desulfobulbaceae bacterium]